ncbi:hypothetical protein B0H13DRAFT_2289960 [Mycena leptocephala]|nr:hypothetical protein B0H13DRAFT_2289960 [Mycena leptocephala]
MSSTGRGNAKETSRFSCSYQGICQVGGVQDKIAEYQKTFKKYARGSSPQINATLATVISPSNILISLVLLHSDLELSDITVVQAARQMNNCPPPSRIFQGRQTILDKMNQFFAQDIGKQHIYVLHGLGGAGKTQIALKFINASLVEEHSNLEKYWQLFSGCIEVAATNQEDWLLFYDNADDPKIDLNRFIPQCNHGNIIITTRNPALRSYAGAHFAVSDMEETDAVALLLKSASQDISSASENIAAEIVKDGISEDIFSRAATYRFQLAIPFREELQKPLEFLAQFLGPAYEWDTFHFLKVTNEIKAYSLMTFDPERKMFSIPSTTRYEEAKGFGLAVLEKQKQVLGDNHSDTFQAMANLASTYQKLGQFHKAEQLEVVVLEKRKQKLGKFHRAEELKVAVLEKRKQVLGDNHPYTLRAMGNLASIYHSLGQSDKAEELEVVVLEMRKQVLGDDHPDTLQAMGNLATAYNHLGKFQQAEELEVYYGESGYKYGDLGKFQQAEELQVIVLEKQKQVLGDDHLGTLWSMGSLASAYHSQELELFVLDKRKQVQGDDHPDTLRATGNLGCTYHQLGQFQKAEELQVIALEKRKKFLGANHPDTLHTMRNLASTYRCLEKLSEAEELEAHVYNYEKALEGSVSENSEGSDEEASDDLTQS